MRIAVTGVSGFIGSYLARTLHRSGHQVTGLVRETSRRDHIEGVVDRFVVGDQADERVWPQLLEDTECVVANSVDWGPLRVSPDLDSHLRRNLLATIKLLHAARSKQFIFVSTIAVHHDMRPRWGGVIDEDHPLRPSSLYGAYKAAVEAHLWAEHFGQGQNVSAVRPCGVYGVDPTMKRSYFYPYLKRIRDLAERGEAFSKPGGGKFVHVQDVADLIAALVGNDDAAGQAYNLVDCYARWEDWARMAAEELKLDLAIRSESPPMPKNVFRKDAVAALGVPLDRGHDGIRAFIRELIDLVGESG
jgi:nucleoside-diphosphate-sugar epimerase